MTIENAGLISANIILVLLVFLTRKKRRLSNFFISVTSLIVILSLIELSYQLFFEKEMHYADDFEEKFFQTDSTLGYKMQNAGTYGVIKLSNKEDTVFNTSYTIIPDTVKPKNPFAHRIGYSVPNDPNEIVFLGCSFTFGEGLCDSLSLPYLTGQLSQTNAINLGCNGYGIHQVYQLFLDRFSTELNENRVFVYTFLYDHFLRANGIYLWNMNGPQFRIEDDSLVRHGKLSDKDQRSRDNLIHYASLFGSLTFLKKMIAYSQENRLARQLDSSDYETGFMMLRNMAQKIKSSGGSLVVLDWDAANWGNKEVSGLPVALIEKKLDALALNGASVIRISSILKHGEPGNFIPVDGHPSGLTNKKIALYLQKQITRFSP